MTFEERVNEFLQIATDKNIETLKGSGLKPMIYKADIGEKWVRVYTYRYQGENVPPVRSSIFAFIAVKDFANRTLGQIKAGDIHKPASFSQPAKHARGNLFNPDYPKCVTPYGITYLN